MEPQDIAGGRYRVEAVLGRGGTATVYRVQDTVLDVPRAVKVLSGSVQVRRALRRRLYAEAKAMARLDHPNILRLYDIGLDGDRDYVVMELAEGGTLGELLRREGPLAPYDALQFSLQILSALAVAHDHGIVHRDVKPENVLLNHTGTALLADFGIAMLAEDTSRSTRVGVTMGSLAYMPPEQRLDARSVEATADVYAVGATLYNLLTDENPIDLFTAAESSSRWAGIPAPLLAVLRKATQIEPAQRYQDAREMAQDVMALLDQIAVEMPPLRARVPESAPPPVPENSQETFLIEGEKPAHKRATKPDQGATDAAIQFLTAVPTDTSTNPTIAPDEETSEVAAPPMRPPLIAGAILAAGALIAAAIALPGLLNTPVTADVVINTDPETPAEVISVDLNTPGDPPTEEPPPAEEPIEEPIEEPPAEVPAQTDPPADPPVEEPPAVVADPPAADPPAEDPPDPVEEPLAAVDPPEDPPEDPPASSGSAVTGGWTGSIRGRVMEVSLSGSNSRLKGTVTVWAGSKSVPTPVRGSFNPDSGVLYLKDNIEADDIGEYSLKLSSDGQRLTGSFNAIHHSQTFPISLKRN